MLDLVVRNGTVVLADATLEMDIGVLGGKVASLGQAGQPMDAREEIDASGLYIFPGFIDAHVHVNMPLGEFVTNDKSPDATRAAAHGGTTTIVDFAIPNPEESPLEALERKLTEAEGNAYVDYSFHGCLVRADEESIRQVPQLIERGIGTVKMFMVYKDRLMLSSGEIRTVMEKLVEHGGTALIHAEDPGIIDHLVDREAATGTGSPLAHLRAHPNSSEVTAMWTIATLVEETGCRTYFVHVSAGEARGVLRYALEKGLPLQAETCPHYLSLASELYEGVDGRNYVCSPPLRSGADAGALWSLIEEGLIQVVNSDHCGYDTEQKSRHPDDFTKIPNGLPGVETKNIVLFSEGVGSGRLTPQEFVALTSTNMARMLDVYPAKGTVKIGSDADLVLFDPDETWTMRAEDMHMRTDYSPFENFQIRGRPKTTIVRGKVVVRDGELVGSTDHGRFVPTGPSSYGEQGRERSAAR
jgi:dihydropyrimidinase